MSDTPKADGFCEDKGCPHHGMKHICYSKKWVIVPEEPTDEMLNAGSISYHLGDKWTSMLSAVPKVCFNPLNCNQPCHDTDGVLYCDVCGIFEGCRRFGMHQKALEPRPNAPKVNPVATSKFTLGRKLREIVSTADTWEDAAEKFLALSQSDPQHDVAVRTEVAFLLDRLDDLADDGFTEDGSRDFHGHVRPSMERLRALTARTGRGEQP